jgi:3-deoxy-7-phosphoheptulonate synthase
LPQRSNRTKVVLPKKTLYKNKKDTRGLLPLYVASRDQDFGVKASGAGKTGGDELLEGLIPIMSAEEWNKDSWRTKPVLQQPDYPCEEEVEKVHKKMCDLPPLVFAGECRNLSDKLAKCSRGEAFWMQGGDCAESFHEFSANHIRDTYRILLQMSVIMMFGGGIPVVKVGRMAGQFAKPRSEPTEMIDGKEYPSYRGDIINDSALDVQKRIPDPNRLVSAYHQSASTLNLIRGFSTGGYARLNRVESWNLDFMQKSDEGKLYMDLAGRVDEAITFMEACGVGLNSSVMSTTDFFVSHEALLLEYEGALTREDSTTGLWYDCSAHLVWVGERTRQLDHAHIEFLRGVGNPLGIKISQKADPKELISLIATLNPSNNPGRLAVIVRMGADNLRERLPLLLKAVKDAGQHVTWVCDPMHGNTEKINGFKTRRFENIRAEVEAFFDVHYECGTIPGGIHLEMTGKNVTECVGGGSAIDPEHLGDHYETFCDPRLNAEQALELSFYIAKRLRQRSSGKDL